MSNPIVLPPDVQQKVKIILKSRKSGDRARERAAWNAIKRMGHEQVAQRYIDSLRAA